MLSHGGYIPSLEIAQEDLGQRKDFDRPELI